MAKLLTKMKIVNCSPRVETGKRVQDHGQGQALPLQKITLGNIIGAFKSLTTNAGLNGKYWQRNFYEHIIRNDSELNRIREYIKTNPPMWDRDRNNPEFKIMPERNQ